ncbi:MAG: DUF5060 domain-containing protein [Chlorobi bacterium]|nr:DUF5060 domain-containing protein [Chlorobiota bacterium]
MRVSGIIFILIFLAGFDLTAKDKNPDVFLYSRFEAMFYNPTWEGNPFDVDFRAVFVSPSGRKVTQLGFYAGNNVWKVYFMPDETGRWQYETSSVDDELNGLKGEFSCVKSIRESTLTTYGKHWVLKTGEGYFPLIWGPTDPDGLHWGFRGKAANDPVVSDALLFANDVVNADLLGIGELFIVKTGRAENWPENAMPYVAGKEGEEFNLVFWNELNAKLDAAASMNMGIYVMFYGDEEMTPDNYGITPYSDKELRLFRYAVARLSCYPHVLWDTGVNIGKYRNDEWINWFAGWFLKYDPWKHPVSSRSGGDSKGIMPLNATYFSSDMVELPSRKELLAMQDSISVPIAHTDHWRPFINRGNWNGDKIRKAVWRCGLSGPQALYVDYNQGTHNQKQVLRGGQFVGHAMHFFKNRLRNDIFYLVPHDEMIIGGGNVILSCKPGEEYVAYDEDGSSFSVNLPGEKSIYVVEWYNPRTGVVTETEEIKGDKDVLFNPPSAGKDWVLHVYLKRKPVKLNIKKKKR